jgi:hypothetical protein
VRRCIFLSSLERKAAHGLPSKRRQTDQAALPGKYA